MSRTRGRRNRFGFQALAQLERHAAMANHAQRAQIVQVAFAAAFDHRKNVIGIPQRAAGEAFQSPLFQELEFVQASCALQLEVAGVSVDTARLADAAVARENLIAKIAGVGTELPLMDAEVGAEGAAPWRRDFKIAPAAKRSSVGTLFKSRTIGETAGHGPGSRQTFLF
jgi:hypothetical protein